MPGAIFEIGLGEASALLSMMEHDAAFRPFATEAERAVLRTEAIRVVLDRGAEWNAASSISGPGTERRFAALHQFGSDWRIADMPPALRPYRRGATDK